MTGAIVVSPGCMMKIFVALGNHSLEKFVDVANQSRLEFHCGYTSGGSGDKDQCLPFFQPTGSKRKA